MAVLEYKTRGRDMLESSAISLEPSAWGALIRGGVDLDSDLDYVL